MFIALLAVTIVVLTGCGPQPATTVPVTVPVVTTTPATSEPAGSQPVETTVTATTPAGSRINTGGTLRIIAPVGPRVLSYTPDMGYFDHFAVSPGVERLLDIALLTDSGIELEPVLCESWEDDRANNRLVFYLRKGVKFHDGTEMTADDVIFQLQLKQEAGCLQFADKLTAVKKLDRYTVELSYSEYNTLYPWYWGYIPVYSWEAWKAAAGDNPRKGKEWARDHLVGTGPFKLGEFSPDNLMTWVKNYDYWQTDRPYLDRIEVRYIADSEVALEVFLSGQADQWISPPPPILLDLAEQGYPVLSSMLNLPYSIFPNTAQSHSKWNDQRLREAIEYALDKKALAQALGSGLYTPLDMLIPEGEVGWDSAYQARSYNPHKARQLLADAGYTGGLFVRLLIADDSVSREAGLLIKSCLDEVGFTIELDIASPERYSELVWGESPGPDLCFAHSGSGVEFLFTCLDWFSSGAFPTPAYLGHSLEQIGLEQELKAAKDTTDLQVAFEKAVRYLSDHCLVIPVYAAPEVAVLQPYVHTDLFSHGLLRWQSEKAWMNRH